MQLCLIYEVYVMACIHKQELFSSAFLPNVQADLGLGVTTTTTAVAAASGSVLIATAVAYTALFSAANL